MTEISREEFQNLYNEVKQTHSEVIELQSRFIAFQTHIVTQELAVKTALELREKQVEEAVRAREFLEKKRFTVLAIIVSIISVVVGVVFKIAM